MRVSCALGQQGHGRPPCGVWKSEPIERQASSARRATAPRRRIGKQAQGQRAEGDESVGQDHRALASQRSIHTPAPSPAATGAACRRGRRTRGSRPIRFRAQVEDHGIAYDGAAQDGYSLSGPDDRELPVSSFAVFHVSCFDPGGQRYENSSNENVWRLCCLLFWTCGESVCAAGRLRRMERRAATRGVRGEKTWYAFLPERKENR